jgi:hypothetical protein
MVGAAAENGMPLAALKALGDDVNRRTRSMGVALLSCTVPAAGRPNFTLADDEMEMGVGIHGEPGRRRVPLAPADAIAEELVGAILKDLAPKQGSEVLLLVNGFGATPLIELYLMVNSAKRILERAGIDPDRILSDSSRSNEGICAAKVARLPRKPSSTAMGSKSRLLQRLENLAVHQERDFGGGERFLAFGQRIEPEIGVGQHFEQIPCGGPKAGLGLLYIVGYAFLGGKGRMPLHALEFDSGNADPFLKFERASASWLHGRLRRQNIDLGIQKRPIERGNVSGVLPRSLHQGFETVFGFKHGHPLVVIICWIPCAYRFPCGSDCATFAEALHHQGPFQLCLSRSVR